MGVGDVNNDFAAFSSSTQGVSDWQVPPVADIDSADSARLTTMGFAFQDNHLLDSLSIQDNHLPAGLLKLR